MSDTGAEVSDVTGLVATSKSLVVADVRRENDWSAQKKTGTYVGPNILSTVDGNVLIVTFAELLDVFVDRFDPAWLTGGHGGVVGMGASAIPVAGQRFRMEGDLDSPVFGDSVKED